MAGAQEEKSFAELGVSGPIVAALADKGITHPFPIQALTLPVALRGNDIIGQAKTGTGKTLGFAIPMLENTIGPGEDGWSNLASPGAPQGLVVLPTRELAKQVAHEMRNAAAHRRLRIVEVYGGVGYESQVAELGKGAEVVVGTPGRILDLLGRHTLTLSHIRTLVLDEADEMLDLGFLEDVEKIISHTPSRRHTMLFSATMPGAVVAMARRYMNSPTHITAHDPLDSKATATGVRQLVYRCHAMNKVEVVSRILQAEGRGLTIIFTKTKRTAAKLTEELTDRDFAVGALHGDLGQAARERALRAFRHGKVDVLIATDVAARGIDIDDVTHVINYQCPEDEKTYIHRIGRTARAGHEGTAITFVDWEDATRWSVINRILDLGIPEAVETYHTSDHLYTDLNIPRDVTGALPRDKRVREGLYSEKLEDLGTRPARKHGRRGSSRRRSEERSSRDASRRRKETREGGSASGGAHAGENAQGRTSHEPHEPRRTRRRRRVRRTEH